MVEPIQNEIQSEFEDEFEKRAGPGHSIAVVAVAAAAVTLAAGPALIALRALAPGPSPARWAAGLGSLGLALVGLKLAGMAWGLVGRAIGEHPARVAATSSD
jgi:hypothetical protein